MVGIKDFDMPSCCNSCNHWSFNRDDEPLCDLTYEYIRQFDKRQDDCPLVETYTKADMVAMLEELKTEIDIMSDSVVEGRTITITSWVGMQKRICKLIQSKIDKLKENTDGSN